MVRDPFRGFQADAIWQSPDVTAPSSAVGWRIVVSAGLAHTLGLGQVAESGRAAVFL